jgi:G3E family GTPase
MRVPTAVPDMHRLPLTVVGGEARTGKTTLLRQLVTQQDAGGVAVVFEGLEPPPLESGGPAQVDGAWTTLQNGSLCGALTGDLSAELAELRHRLPSTSHVLVEARGDASLRRVAGYGYMPGYRPDGTVVVMSAHDMDDSLGKTDRREAMTARLRGADILVLNMMDVVPAAARARCRYWLDIEMSRLRVIETTHGRVAGPLLLGMTPDAAKRDARAVSGNWETTTHRTAGRTRPRSTASESAEPACRLWRLETDRAIAARQFRSWISLLPRSVVRGAGDVLIEEDPQLRYQFRMIGHRWQLQREGPWGATAPETRVALVGM